ncbi:MAG: 2-oxoacid:acceptor oxidoreductase family protein [bacterium]|nr:2-oxoacid:acceptor oxidoreductase family protein [bacterium]
MNDYKTTDANSIVSTVAYNFSEICGIYPITPASPMAENIDILSNQNKLNFFKNKVKVIEMQSEAGAIALVHGALQAGVLASSFTASQGLLLMIPTLYKLSGEMLPAVIHVAARSLSTHALSILGDHQDIYATRQTGVCILASSSVQQSYHFANIAHLSAISSSLPFIHFFDGFRTSHEINKIKILNDLEIKKLLDVKGLYTFRNKALNVNKPNTRGTNENDDIYFQNTEARNIDYEQVIEITINYLNKINNLANTNYQPFNYYGDKDATTLIVAMGSVCQTIKETIDYLITKNKKVGLIEVHLYRPFSAKHLIKVLPNTIKRIAVLDRTKEFGSIGEPLYLDVVASLKDLDIKIIGGRYGLSSKNTTPSHIKAIYDYLSQKNPSSNFTIGIDDDVTKRSIPYNKNFHIPLPHREILIYGYGSDGMVGTSKDIIKIIGEYTPLFVQSYSQYDSKKSGSITRSHIRISKNEILSTYYVDNPELIVISKDNYLYNYDILDNIKQNGIVLLNTNLFEQELVKTLPNRVKKQLADKNITIYIINATSIATNHGLKNKISTCLEICIFKLLNIIKEDYQNFKRT